MLISWGTSTYQIGMGKEECTFQSKRKVRERRENSAKQTGFLLALCFEMFLFLIRQMRYLNCVDSKHEVTWFLFMSV